MKIVFQISGGIGKSIAATAVCRAIKKQYPAAELIVITGYPEVFMQNPYVSKALSHNNLNYFYADHIENQPDTRPLPAVSTGFRYLSRSLLFSTYTLVTYQPITYQPTLLVRECFADATAGRLQRPYTK